MFLVLISFYSPFAGKVSDTSMTEPVTEKDNSNLEAVRENDGEQADKNYSAEMPSPPSDNTLLVVDESDKISRTNDAESTNNVDKTEESDDSAVVVKENHSNINLDNEEVQIDESNTGDIRPVMNAVNIEAYRDEVNILTNSENSDSSDSDSSSTVSDDNDASDNDNLSLR